MAGMTGVKEDYVVNAGTKEGAQRCEFGSLLYRTHSDPLYCCFPLMPL